MSPSNSANAYADLDDSAELESHLASSLIEAFADRSIPIRLEVQGDDPSRKGIRERRLGVRQNRILHLHGKTGQFTLTPTKDGRGYLLVETKWKKGQSAAGGIEGAVRHAIRTTVSEGGGRLALIDPAILHIAEVLGRTLPMARQKISENTIEKLVDALLETQDPTAAVSAQIDAGNAEARVRFMNNFATLSADEVTEAAGSKARNRSQTPSRWKSEGKIFSVPWQGAERYPAFQFKDGRPLPVISQILALLPDTMSAWEVAFWFVSTNGWLDDAAPRQVLADIPSVVRAARLEGEAVVG